MYAAASSELQGDVFGLATSHGLLVKEPAEPLGDVSFSLLRSSGWQWREGVTCRSESCEETRS
eukprot:746143-Hanusia_phi.AAC.4